MGLTLLEKATEGNKRAFKKLMQRDSEFIYKLAFLHTKYEYDAKKIMQNSILYINNSISYNIRTYRYIRWCNSQKI